MSKRLIITEKPSVAKDVAKAFPDAGFRQTPFGFESSDMVIAAAAGHLVETLPPEKYDEAWGGDWNFDVLPMVPERFMYKPRDSRASDRLKQIKQLVERDDVTELVNACDAGREGELIFKLIVQYTRTTKPIVRAWFSSMTPAAIRSAFDSLRPDAELVPLEYAARCRSEADWVVGMNATRAASVTLGGGRMLLSVGRVQTPTLALIVNRDVEISDFVSTDYWTVSADFTVDAGSFTAAWRAAPEAGSLDRFTTEADAKAAVTRVQDTASGTVDSVEVQEATIKAPRLFDLTLLQREANKRFGFTAVKTLSIAQALYETHKYTTYPRTDSQFITDDMIPVVPNVVARVKAADKEAYGTAADLAASADPKPIVNNAKVTDHHAIIPTDAAHDLKKLSADELKIYDLVARRFLASLLPAQKVEKTVAWVRVVSASATDWFRVAGTVELEPGWRVATDVVDEDDLDDDDSDDSALCPLVADEDAHVDSVKSKKSKTKPPAAWTEATLLGAMSTAGKLIDDQELADAMKDSGLGTPATRAGQIETLIKRDYISRSGRKIVATNKGRGLILALGDHPLTKADMTGEWERRLRVIERCDSVEEATSLRAQFTAAAVKFATKAVSDFEGKSLDDLNAGRRTVAPCPVEDCEGSLFETKKGWGCSSYRSKEERGCGFVWWKQSGGKRRTEKQLVAFLADVASGKAELSLAPAERTVVADCPKCGSDQQIVERAKGWGCSSWNPKDGGCGTVIWKQNQDGSPVAVEQALEMLKRGESNGRPPAEVYSDCPRCGSKAQLLDRGKMLSCNSWKSKRSQGCRTTVWKTLKDGTEKAAEQIEAEVADLVGTKAPARRKK